MSNDLDFKELDPGNYPAVVERVRYIFAAMTEIKLTYKLDMPNGGVRRVIETLPVQAPPAAANYFQTTRGLGRVAEILRTQGRSIADVQAAGGLKALPGLLEGSAIRVVTRNQRVAGFKCPVVVRIEKI